jgi:hypothetical protein
VVATVSTQTIRAAAAGRMPLDGADAQALEHALTQAEDDLRRERKMTRELRGERERLRIQNQRTKDLLTVETCALEQMCSSQEMAEQVRSAVAGERSALDSVDGLMRSIDILGKEMAELRDTLGKIASLYNGFVNGEPRPDWAADQVLAAIGAALGPPWQDSPVSRT